MQGKSENIWCQVLMIPHTATDCWCVWIGSHMAAFSMHVVIVSYVCFCYMWLFATLACHGLCVSLHMFQWNENEVEKKTPKNNCYIRCFPFSVDSGSTKLSPVFSSTTGVQIHLTLSNHTKGMSYWSKVFLAGNIYWHRFSGHMLWFWCDPSSGWWQERKVVVTTCKPPTPQT